MVSRGDFLAAVRRRGGLDDLAADRVCRAVLVTLADELPGRLRNSVAGYLPPELTSLVRDDTEPPHGRTGGGQHDVTIGDVVSPRDR